MVGHRQSGSSSWRTLARSFAPRATRGQIITGLLCALLGFALVVQLQSNHDEGLSSLRQDELVRILDDVTPTRPLRALSWPVLASGH